jgi:hypothetical protein
MKLWIAALVGGICVLTSVSCGRTTTTRSAQATGTVTGRVVCLVCYTRNKTNTGHDHDEGFACDRACVRWEGQPAALVTADGKVYQFAGGVVANNNEKIAAYLAETVTATGTLSEKDGMTMIATDDVVRVADESQ